MTTTVQERLDAANITLPTPSTPAANYVPYVVSGNQVFISGQVPIVDGSVEGNTGIVGDEVSVEDAKKIARICALNLLAQAKAANNGSLENIRCVKLGVFVQATNDFTQHPEVANGASDLMVEVLGDDGKHARFAVGAVSLPRGVAVEVDGVFELLA